MIEITENLKARNAIKIKSVGSKIIRTLQAHCRAILICPKTVTIDSRYAKIRRAIKKDTLKFFTRLTILFLTTAYK